MANLNSGDTLILENLFKMQDGCVLDFSNKTLKEFFKNDFDIDIYSDKYNYDSGSKANRMKEFWRVENNNTVGRLIMKLIDRINTKIMIEKFDSKDYPDKLMQKAREIANKLLGEQQVSADEQEFLNKEYREISLEPLLLDNSINNIIEQRIQEINASLNISAPLSVIFLCGSALEGIFLGLANKYPKEFNSAKSAPKTSQNTARKIDSWTLSDYIKVAKELGIIQEDVRKHSDALRSFRNYIHPYQQHKEKFTPTKYTSAISFQVLKAAISQISEWESKQNEKK